MGRIDVRRFGLAFGCTGALLYLGCMLVMAMLSEGQTILFFNKLLHGLDVAPIIKMDVPIWQAGMGLLQTFILAWLVGASVASIYNFTLDTGSTAGEDE